METMETPLDPPLLLSGIVGLLNWSFMLSNLMSRSKHY